MECVLKKNKKSKEAGFSIMDLLIWGSVVAVAMGFIFLVVYPYFNAWKTQNSIRSDFSALSMGLDNYYSVNMKYPLGSGWAWASDYVPLEVTNKGWQYSCSGNTMRITTPSIGDLKVRAKILASFNKSCNQVSVVGASIQCTLFNKPCY